MASNVADVVRACFDAFVAKDRPAIEALLADDFRFTSPVDRNLDRAQYFEKCWPFSEQVRNFDLEKLFVQGNEAFVRYLCEPKEGKKFRNTELFRVDGGRIKEVEVYFGYELP